MNPRTAPAHRRVQTVSDSTGVNRVSGRPIHAYWLLLAPHVREILLAPERHLGEHTLAWSWELPENDAAESFSKADCSTARSHLTTTLECLRLELERAEGSASDERHQLLRQLSSSLDAWAAGLLARSDAQLAGYLARTERGLMFHSWGLSHPAAPVDRPSAPAHDETNVTANSTKRFATHRLRRRIFLILSIATVLALALLGALRGCKPQATSPTTAAITNAGSKSAAGEQNSRSAMRRNENEAAPVASQSHNVSGPTHGFDQEHRLPAAYADNELIRNQPRLHPSSRTNGGEAFKSRDGVPPVAASGASGPAQLGSAGVGGGVGIPVSGDSAGTAGVTAPTGAPPELPGAFPVSDSSVQSDGASSSAGDSASAVPSGQAAAGNQTVLAPVTDGSVDQQSRASTPKPEGPDAPANAESEDPAQTSPDPEFESPQPAQVDNGDAEPSDDDDANSTEASPDSADTEADSMNLRPEDRDDANSPAAPTDPTASDRFADEKPEAARESAASLLEPGVTSDQPSGAMRSKHRASGLETYLLRLRTLNWRTELLHDAILPTAPLPGRQTGTVERLREQLWQSHRAARPVWMAAPSIQIVVTISWPDEIEPGDLRIDGFGGDGAVVSKRTANALDLSWPISGAPTVVTVSSASSAPGQPHAVLRFDAGAVEARARRPFELRAHLSIGLPADTDPPSHQWRLISGPTVAMPAIAVDADAARLELPSVASVGGPSVRTLALVHQASGWALVGDVETSVSLRSNQH